MELAIETLHELRGAVFKDLATRERAVEYRDHVALDRDERLRAVVNTIRKEAELAGVETDKQARTEEEGDGKHETDHHRKLFAVRPHPLIAHVHELTEDHTEHRHDDGEQNDQRVEVHGTENETDVFRHELGRNENEIQHEKLQTSNVRRVIHPHQPLHLRQPQRNDRS